jgi:hypothetical protein
VKRALLYLWQLPQHLLGLLLIRLLGAKRIGFQSLQGGKVIWFWQFERKGRLSRFISGGSFGNYILLPPRGDMALTVPHEYGHSIQSLYWGPLYLLTVGIVSAVFNNLWDRIFHKKWTAEKRIKWYYSRWPEKQADKLGGVERWPKEGESAGKN